MRVGPVCAILDLLDTMNAEHQGTAIIALDMLLQDRPDMLSDAVKAPDSQPASSLVWHVSSALVHTSSSTQSAALRCLRVMAESPTLLCCMAGISELEHLLQSFLDRCDLADILNAAWLLHLLQQPQQTKLSRALSADPLQMRGLRPKCSWKGMDPGLSEQHESSNVRQLVQMLQGSAHELLAEAVQSKAEAACALHLLIMRRCQISGLQAASGLQVAAAQQGGLQFLVHLLSCRALLQLHAMSALRSLICNHYGNQAALMQQGSLGTVITLCMSTCGEVAKSAAGCVGSLLHNWPGQPVALATKTALQSLVTELDCPSQERQERAAQALSLIANARPMNLIA